MAQVTVTIDGKQYRMACDEGQDPKGGVDITKTAHFVTSSIESSFSLSRLPRREQDGKGRDLFPVKPFQNLSNDN